MTYYKTIKAIQQGLYENDVPDDLFDMMFQFYGDFDETIDDLINKHCFYKILCSSFIRELKGYYCSVCNKFLEFRTTKQLKRHTLCKSHRIRLQKYIKNEKQPTKDEIRKCCADSWFSGLPQINARCVKNFTDDLRPEPIIIDFKKM